MAWFWMGVLGVRDSGGLESLISLHIRWVPICQRRKWIDSHLLEWRYMGHKTSLLIDMLFKSILPLVD